MSETRGGFGEHTRHNEQRGGHARGNAEGQSRRSQEYAGSARQEDNERVLQELRDRLGHETTTIHPPDEKGFTRTTRIHFPDNAPIDPRIAADVDAALAIPSLPWYKRQRAWEELNTRRHLRGLSVAEYLARNPNADPDLFTADGRYLPACRFGDLRYDLKKLGKFVLRALDFIGELTEDKKEEEKPHLVIVQPSPEEQ